MKHSPSVRDNCPLSSRFYWLKTTYIPHGQQLAHLPNDCWVHQAQSGTQSGPDQGSHDWDRHYFHLPVLKSSPSFQSKRMIKDDNKNTK